MVKVKILVTGGKGLIGSHLVNYLKHKGHWVRNVDIESFSYLETKEDEFLPFDLRNYWNAKKAVEDIDWVFNLAANMGGIKYITEQNAPIMRDNALININMLEASRNAGVKRFFFSSSACVYPRYLQSNPKIVPLKESDVIPAQPDSPYGWEKLFTEILCRSYEHDYRLAVRIARFHNVFGPFSTYKGGKEKAPAALCRKVAEAKDSGTIEIWGDGNQSRSFLYIDDALEAIMLLMESNYAEPLNIGSDRIVTINELAEMIIKISGKNLKIKHDLSKPQGVRGRNASLELVKKVIGWEPKISLEEGLHTTFRWIEEMVRS